jgi:hypothetical protein
MTIEQFNHVMTGGLAPTAQIQDGGDLGEGKTGRLSIAHKAEPDDGLLGIVPVIVGRTIRFGEDPYVLVIADGLGSCAGAQSQLSDSHGLNLHLLVDWNVKTENPY